MRMRRILSTWLVWTNSDSPLNFVSHAWGSPQAGSPHRASLPVRAGPPKPGTQLLGMPADIFEQATPFLLAADCFVEGRVRLGRQVRGDQRKTLVESPPPVFNGGQREMKAPRKFDVGIAENGMAQHPLLSPGETESRRCVDEYRRRDMTEVPGDVSARQAKEKGTLAERGQRFAPILEIAGVVRSHCVGT